MGGAVALEALLEDASRIPAAPGVALELSRLCRESDTSIERLVAVLQCDPTLTAKVLRMANSAYFASRRQIGNLAEAVVRLGLRRVQVMSLAFCIIEATSAKSGRSGQFNYNYFWSHAVVTGTFADAVASARRLKLRTEAMVAGLLQDIGVLVIQTASPEKYKTVLAHAGRALEDLWVTETRRLGFNHMEAGELLLRRWHLPEQICLAVGHHHEPSAAESAGVDVVKLVEACELGAMVAKFLTLEQGRKAALVRSIELAQKNFGMTPEEFQNLMSLVRMKLESSAEMLEVALDETMLHRLDAAIRDRIAEAALSFPEGGEPPQ